MVGAEDVAAALIGFAGPLDQMKLQKLLYYAQGWHLAWYDSPLFRETIEAWTWGPAVPSVYRVYKEFRDQPFSEPAAGDSGKLSGNELAALAAVADGYRGYSGLELMAATHDEYPWLLARRGLDPNKRSKRAIPLPLMKEHFRRHAVFGGQNVEIASANPEILQRVIQGDGSALDALLEQTLGVRVQQSG